MNESVSRQPSYGRGIALMTLVCMPLTLAAASVLAWLESQGPTPLWKVFTLNAVPLYLLSLIPNVGVSSAVICMRRRQLGSDAMLPRVRTVVLAGLLGAVAAFLVGLFLLRDLRGVVLLGAPVTWGLVNGALYGAIVVTRWEPRAEKASSPDPYSRAEKVT